MKLSLWWTLSKPHLKIKIFNVHNIFTSCPIIFQICPEYNNATALLCTEFIKDWLNYWRGCYTFSRFNNFWAWKEFKMDFQYCNHPLVSGDSVHQNKSWSKRHLSTESWLDRFQWHSDPACRIESLGFDSSAGNKSDTGDIGCKRGTVTWWVLLELL